MIHHRRLIRSLQQAGRTYFLHLSHSKAQSLRSIVHGTQSMFQPPKCFLVHDPWNFMLGIRNFSYGLVNVVVSNGKPKLEAQVTEPPKKLKWRTKKRLKMQRKREKQLRKSANTRDPRCLGVEGKKKKQKFPNAEQRIKYKIEKAKIKEALLIERLKKYEVRNQQGPVVKPENLTGEEMFYMKKMAQKRSNYVPVGRRGVFGGVILNMHLHWKKHETVEVICKPCKPGQVHEYAEEISRLSGGIPIRIIGNDTIIFYRGKDYVQPEVMSPIDTLSKKKALEKSKYEQSLESVRHFIAIAEKELELYYRHVALYGESTERTSYSVYTSAGKGSAQPIYPDMHTESFNSDTDCSSIDLSDTDQNSTDQKLRHDGNLSGSETDFGYESLSDFSVDSEDEEGTSNSHCRSDSISDSFNGGSR